MSDEAHGVRTVVVPGWPEPAGYADGVVFETKRTLCVAGQIGWNAKHEFESDDFTVQFAQALDNVLAVVRAAGGTPSSVVKMTMYVTDMDAYRASRKRLGPVWKERFGRHFPAMALVAVTALVERGARVEIEATCALEDP